MAMAESGVHATVEKIKAEEARERRLALLSKGAQQKKELVHARLNSITTRAPTHLNAISNSLKEAENSPAQNTFQAAAKGDVEVLRRFLDDNKVKHVAFVLNSFFVLIISKFRAWTLRRGPEEGR